MTTLKQNLQYLSSYHTTNGAGLGHDTSLLHFDGWNMGNHPQESIEPIRLLGHTSHTSNPQDTVEIKGQPPRLTLSSPCLE